MHQGADLCRRQRQCPYCIASHTAAARKAGMSDEMFA
ncbi:MAG: carboxymuconolactone decarboxylase family protein, partial [Bryobacteraceae bacterium]